MPQNNPETSISNISDALGLSEQEQLSEQHNAGGGQQQTGFVYEPGAEGSTEWQGHVGPSASQQVVSELNPTNLDRLQQQPMVRGPLYHMALAEKTMMDSIRVIHAAIGGLGESIRSNEEMVIYLKQAISTAWSNMQSDVGCTTEQWVEMEQMERQLFNTEERVKHDVAEVRRLDAKLAEYSESINAHLGTLGLTRARIAEQFIYPARVNMAEDTEAVPEGDRPSLNFDQVGWQ